MVQGSGFKAWGNFGTKNLLYKCLLVLAQNKNIYNLEARPGTYYIGQAARNLASIAAKRCGTSHLRLRAAGASVACKTFAESATLNSMTPNPETLQVPTVR